MNCDSVGSGVSAKSGYQRGISCVTFSRGDFTFDKEQNEYRCPNGKVLRTTGMVHDGRTIPYRASKFDCDPCPLRPTWPKDALAQGAARRERSGP